MSFLYLFDKWDDILYKPIDAVCEWLKEPLRDKDAKRKAQIEEVKCRVQAELEQFAADNQLARNQAMLEAIQQYQVGLAKAMQEIILNIGEISFDLRSKASDMLLAKTREYKALQDEAIQKADRRLLEIKERYADDERVRIQMEDTVIGQMGSIIKYADKFIEELADDLRVINDTIQEMIRAGIHSTDRILDMLRIQIGFTAGTSSVKMELPADSAPSSFAALDEKKS